MRKLVVLGILFVLMAGCNSLSSFQREEHQNMITAGYDVQEKSTLAGALLGFLPGFGSFYSRQYDMGIIDLILWPGSVLWDPFSGYSGAEYINYYATKRQIHKCKKEKLTELEDQVDNDLITEKEFAKKARSIKREFDFTP